MSIVALLAVVGVVLLGVGLVRSSLGALVLGGLALADAMALYVIFGPGADAVRSLLGR